MQLANIVPETVDVLIVGGGINGISTFRELALQGARVALIEREDFCSGASAALSRMVHGGLRYLENGEFGLVHESLVERDRLLRNAPHVVFPLPTIVPLNTNFRGAVATVAQFFGAKRREGAQRPAIIVQLGLTLYDLFSWRTRMTPRHQSLSRHELQRLVPHVTPDAIGGVLYYDARVTLPERLGLEMILDTERDTGARAFSYTELISGDNDALEWRDRLTGKTGRIKAGIVINATGAWVDFVEAILRPGAHRRRVEGTKGSHLMIRNASLQAALAQNMIYYENRDGRICIAFNHLGLALVGSTDIRIDDPDAATCLEDEKAYMLAALRNVFPDIEIRDDEIVHVFTGVRPLPSSEAGQTARISRDHFVEDHAPAPGRSYRVLTLMGGKWTTFRAFGAEVADLALRHLGMQRHRSTECLPIGGGRDFPVDSFARSDWQRTHAQAAGIDLTRFEVLALRYGSRAVEAAQFLRAEADAPLTLASDYSRRELLWIVENERVRDLSDVILRRTSLGIEGRASEALISEIAAVVAPALRWSETERQAAVVRLSETIKRRHRVQPVH